MLDLYENECLYNFYLLFNKDNPAWCENMDRNYEFVFHTVYMLNMRLEATGRISVYDIHSFLGMYWDKNWEDIIILDTCFLDLQITKLEESLFINIRVYES